MGAIFGFSSDNESGEKRKSKVTYGKLSRPATKNAPPQTAARGKLPSASSSASTSRLPSRRPSAKPSPGIVRDARDLGSDSDAQTSTSRGSKRAKADKDEWDMTSEEETPRPKKIASKVSSVKKTPPRASPSKTSSSRRPVTPSSEPLTPPPRKRKRPDADPVQVVAPSPERIAHRVEALQPAKSPRPQHGLKSELTYKSAQKSRLPAESSAPATLSNMVSAPSLNPPRIAVTTSPQRLPNRAAAKNVQTPPRQNTRSTPSLTKSASLTPKQSQLWDQLLDHSDTGLMSAQSAGRMLNQKLESQSGPSLLDPNAISPMNGTGRVRLADRLKQDSQLSAEESQDELSDESDDDELEAAQSQIKAATQATSSIPQSFESSGPKHTYSQTRSYLQESLTFEESLLRPLTEDGPDLNSNSKFKPELDLESDDEPTQNLRTVHELRAAGSRKRFMDEMEAIVEDAKDHSRSAWSRRRSALTELSQKLLSSDFALRFIESSYATSLVKEFESFKPADTVADTILFVILAQLTYIEVPLHLVEHICQPPVIAWLSEHIGNDRAIASLARDRLSNMSKMSQESYVEFMKSTRDCTFWGGLPPDALGTEVLALKALQGVLVKTRKTGQRQAVLADREQVMQVVRVININESELKQSLGLSILEQESVSMTSQSTASAAVWVPATIEALLSTFAEKFSEQKESPLNLAAYLRLLLNVTNNQPTNCAAFASTRAAASSLFAHISSTFLVIDGSETDLDLLLLSLGLAINLAEHSDAVRTCLPESTIESLTETFVRGEQASSQADSLEQSRINVAFGYLSILLANLCLNDHVKATARSKLPGRKIELLVHSVEEFLGYHRRVDSGEQMDEGAVEDRDEAWGGFTERLGAVVRRLRR